MLLGVARYLYTEKSKVEEDQVDKDGRTALDLAKRKLEESSKEKREEYEKIISSLKEIRKISQKDIIAEQNKEIEELKSKVSKQEKEIDDYKRKEALWNPVVSVPFGFVFPDPDPLPPEFEGIL